MSQVPASASKNRPLVVGILGGIGSGKSEVARLFVEEGKGVLISGDELGHQALRDPSNRAQIVARWGSEVVGPDGEVDRKQLGRRVFANPGELRELEQLVHPWIEARIHEQMTIAQQNPECSLIILDAAIMLEAGWESVCDRLVFVDTPRETRLARLARTRGWTEEQLQAREKAQLPLEAKMQRANDIVTNAGQPEELRAQVTRFLTAWRGTMPSP